MRRTLGSCPARGEARPIWRSGTPPSAARHSFPVAAANFRRRSNCRYRPKAGAHERPVRDFSLPNNGLNANLFQPGLPQAGRRDSIRRWRARQDRLAGVISVSVQKLAVWTWHKPLVSIRLAVIVLVQLPARSSARVTTDTQSPTGDPDESRLLPACRSSMQVDAAILHRQAPYR